MEGLFYRAIKVFHQDIFASLPGVPKRFVSYFAAIFSAVSALQFIFRPAKKVSIILIISLLKAFLPAVFSDATYVKRGAVIYAYLAILAGISTAQFLSYCRDIDLGRFFSCIFQRLLITGGVVWICIAAEQWVGGKMWVANVPRESMMAKGVSRILKCSTLLMLVVVSYFICYESDNRAYWNSPF